MSQQRMGFGPWSSALDNGTRLELSAFWRRRMAGLARLPLGRRVSRRWTAVGVIAALLVGVTPLVEFSSRAVADGEPAAVEKPAGKVEGEEFVWRFSNGLEVELIGFAKNPSKGEPWWRPDGTPLKDASLPSARYRSTGGSVRELAFRWRNASDDSDQSRSWHTLPHYSGAGGGVTVSEADGSILQVAGVSFDGDPKEIAVTFTASVSSTPWQTAFECDGRNPMSSGSVADGKIRSVAFAPAYEAKTGVAITVSYGIGDESGRVIAIDKAGREHLATRQTGVGSTHFDQTTFEFDKLALDDIDRFELQTQTRTLETVEFRNVSLDPGQMTNVEATSRASTTSGTAGENPTGERPEDSGTPEATGEAKDEGSELLRKLWRAGAPLLATMAAEHGYGLAENQGVKRVAPPFPEVRMEWYWAGHPWQAKSIPTGPDSMLFRWEDGKLNGWGMSFGKQRLSDILKDVTDVYPQDMVGLGDSEDVEIEGDWVIDPAVPREERLTQLEAILNRELALGVQLRFEGIERDVYVARGDYRFQPLPGQPAVDETQLTDRIQRTDPIQVFGAKLVPDSGAGGGAGDWDEFLEWVGRWIDGQIVDDVTIRPANEISWRLHEPSPFTDAQRKAARDQDLVLANITKQTGIEFSKEKRKVRVLKVEFTKAVEEK